LSRKNNPERVFNPLKRKVLRRHYSRAELVFGPSFLVVLVLIGAWVLAQENRFDPGERDIDFAVLLKGSVEDNLYRRPTQLWVEPGTVMAGGPTFDLGILPASFLDDGWQPDGRLESYDPSNLYEKINGAAEQYLAFGFKELSYLTVAQDNATITLELYDQGSFPNVLGLFAAQGGGARDVERSGDMFFFRTTVGAIGGVGNYYFKISASTDSAPVVEKAMAMTADLKTLPMSGGGAPLPYQALTTGLDVPFSQVSYVKENVFQYDFLSEFWFAPAGDGEARMFLHQSGSAKKAADDFASLVEEQSYEYQVIQNEPTRVVLKHEFLNTIFTVILDGPLIYGIDGATDADEADSLIARIRKVVTDG